MPIFGLITTEKLAQSRDTDFRRRIFYEFPDGGFPITGLLSLMEAEETVDPTFSHWEKRVRPISTKTASQGGNKGPFLASNGNDLGSPADFTAGTSYRICVGNASRFREGSVIRISVLLNSGSTRDFFARVTNVNASGTPNQLFVRAIESLTGVLNGTTNQNVNRDVLQIGTAFHEGRENVVGESVEVPTKVYNYTQIFRTPFTLSRTALKAPLLYDKTGQYRDTAKEALFHHMTAMEYAFLFGRRREEPGSGAIDTTTGSGLPLRFTGGLIYFLERWEAGDYIEVDAANDDSFDKRIIENPSGVMSEEQYDRILQRLFSRGSKRTPERLCVCGIGFLGTINAMFKGNTNLTAKIPATEAYGMKVTEHVTPFGVVYYKTHPLFDCDPETRYWGLFVDIWSLKYRPLKDSDTKLLKMRQPNDADYRKDEWLTEAGLEVSFPERCMLVKNVRQAIT